MRIRRGAVLQSAAVAVLLVICAGVIGRVRPVLTERLAKGEGSRDDLYVLPSPERVAVMSLGYRSALADLLWGHALVWSGIAFVEKRRFAYLGEYLDVINALDPQFRDPYLNADLLLTFQVIPTPLEDYYKAREVLERGVAEHADDAELWLQLGQFVGTLAPAYIAKLEDEEKAQAWEMDGARYVARACELGASDPKIVRFCAVAAGLYAKLGKDQALESFLERLIGLTDNPEVRERALWKLEAMRGERVRIEARERAATMRLIWSADLPFVSRLMYASLGPPFNTWKCAGVRSGSEQGADCATRWGPYLDERAALDALNAPDLPDSPGE